MKTKFTLLNAIQKEKRKLTKIARTKGLYENFGQREVQILQSKFIDCYDRSTEMNEMIHHLRIFDHWCMNLSIENLQK